MFPVPKGKRCRMCGNDATGFHPYGGWLCYVHQIWAQAQFVKTMGPIETVIDYEI